jgi:hypothetical protein
MAAAGGGHAWFVSSTIGQLWIDRLEWPRNRRFGESKARPVVVMIQQRTGRSLRCPSPEPLAIATSLASRLLSPEPFATLCEASPEAVVERRLLCRPCFS